MSALEIIVAFLRGTHVAALASLFGTLLFLAVVAHGATSEALSLQRRLLRTARISASCALVIGLAWLAVESAVMAGADGIIRALHALPVVAFRTQFGQWLLLRFVLLAAMLPLLRARRAGITTALVLAGAALAVQPLIGHAGAIGGGVGSELIASEVLHLLAAAAWLGGLLPLFFAVRALPPHAAATTCRAFTPIGLAAVVLLAGTAVVQVAELMGGLPGLFGTVYGHVALVKLGLFVVLLAIAALNRFALIYRLDAANPIAARRHMRASLATEAVLGALVLLTAGFLASQTPGTHEQPVWPFAWRPSLEALSDPDLRWEPIIALAASGVALVIAVTGLLWRRIRWPALAAGTIILAAAIPHLDLLFVEAYPTSFFTSPTEFAATAIVHGAKLFAANCTDCHGANGRGDGPAAPSLPIHPADLTAEHFWAHSDGELYWYLSHGFEAPDGSVAMPGFAGVLSSEARWDLIDFMRAHNAGASMWQLGKWSHPLHVPQFDATCPDGRMIDLDDLRGRVLRVIAVSGNEPAASASPAGVDVTTIVLARDRAARRQGTACVADEPEAWTGFSIILGVADDTLAGTQILVDRNAWLRMAWRPSRQASGLDVGDWTDPRVLEAAIRDIAAHPIPVDTSTGHVHPR